MHRIATWTGPLAGIVAVLLVIAMLSAGIDAVRTGLKRRQTRELLALLDRAAAAYVADTGGGAHLHPEVSHGPSRVERGDPDGERAAERCLAMMHASLGSGVIIERIPEVLRTPVAEDGDRKPTLVFSPRAADGGSRASRAWTVQDGWGRGLRCLVPWSGSASDRLAAEAHGGRAVFISAGEDGQFESPDGAADADNLRSDEAP